MLGAILGAVSVVFILQNTSLVTVTFLSWQFEGSLAPILFLTIACGVLITLLLILPSVFKESLYLSRMKKRMKQLEDELTTTKSLLTDFAAAQPQKLESAPVE